MRFLYEGGDGRDGLQIVFAAWGRCRSLFEAYIRAEEGEEWEGERGPNDRYNLGREGELLSAQAGFNGLSLCHRD